MKKLLSIAFLAIGMMVNAQGFIQNEYATISIYADPSASVKEGGFNFGAEVQLISYWKYVKAGFQSFDTLKGGYFDATGTFGINITSDIFETTRYYAGVRLGFIQRGYKDEQSYTYPLAGFEGGIDYSVTDSFFVGVRGTGDYRQDFQFSGADPEMRYSGFIVVGLKLN